MTENFQADTYELNESRFGLQARVTVWRETANGRATHLIGSLWRDSEMIFAKTFNLDASQIRRCGTADFRPEDFIRPLVKEFASLPWLEKLKEVHLPVDSERVTSDYERRFHRLFEMSSPPDSVEEPLPEHLLAYNSFTSADGEILAKIALDRRFESLPVPAVYAPVHAWRVIGIRRLKELAPLLKDLFLISDEDDWIEFDFPYYFAKLGAAAVLPVLGELVDNPAAKEFHLLVASELWTLVGKTERAETLDFLIEKLENYRVNGSTVNSLLIAGLLDLKSARGLSLIEKVIRHDPECLDDMIGTKSEVRREIREIRSLDKIG